MLNQESLSGALNIKRRRMKKQQQMMPNKGWEINDTEEDNDMIQLLKIILKTNSAP